MSKANVDAILLRAETLAVSMNVFVPNETRSIQFRADLAGLLVVDLVASYENCVKETVVDFAAKHHQHFGIFAQNQFERLNSKIKVSDLHILAKKFDTSINDRFKKSMARRKRRYSKFLGQDPEKYYEQILRWRHDFAHAGIRNTTIEEAIKVHRLAKTILYSFSEAFD